MIYILFSNLFNSIKNTIKKTVSFYIKKKYSVIFSIYFLNKYFNFSIINLFLTSFGIVTLYQNRYTILENSIDLYFITKLGFLRLYNSYYKEQDFKLISAKLYLDIKNNIDVTDYIKNIKKIDKNIIIDLLHINKISFNYDEDLRLKINFNYKCTPYIIYYTCEELIKYENIYDNKSYRIFLIILFLIMFFIYLLAIL